MYVSNIVKFRCEYNNVGKNDKALTADYARCMYECMYV